MTLKFFHRLFSWHTVIALVWLCGLVSTANAEKMETTIQEAIYIFEMKGESSTAIKLLEDAANNGDEDDKEKAYFYLGKIQELSGNKASANFYYNQSLNRTAETGKAYWLSERESATSSQAENLLRTPISLKTPISRTFGESPTFLQLRDGTIHKIEDDKLVQVSQDLPANAQVLTVTQQGVWYQSPENDSLVFKSFYANRPDRKYNLAGINQFLVHEDKAIAQGNNQLTLLNSKGIKAQISEKYSGCVPEGFYGPTAEFVLNCTDNALHFISPEDGSDRKTIAQFDVIKKVLIDKSLIYLVSGNYLYGYNPKQRTSPLWKVSINNVESIVPFEKNIAILEASGKITFISKKNGFPQVSAQSDATAIYTLAKGTLGLFSSEGTIIAVDTMLVPLWHFNFTKPIEHAPIHTNGNIYLDFGDHKLTALSPHYYGKKILQSELTARQAAKLVEEENWEELQPLLTTLFKQEPGNAEGWFFKALYLENQNGNNRDKQKAWSEAVRLSASSPQVTRLILNRYSKAIGAKFVNQLPISPKTLYPQFFSSKKYIYTIDPAAEKLFCFNAENGDLRWSRNIGNLNNSHAIDNDENTLAVASGYNMSVYDLAHENAVLTLQLPGKAFETKVTDKAIYVSTWNGFLLKILKSDNKLAWSRKIFAVPFLLATNSKELYVCNLEGELVSLNDDSGQTKEGSTRKIPGQITHILSSDSIIAVATSGNRLYLTNPNSKDTPPLQILMDDAISSLQLINDQGERKFLIGLANQSVLLYTESGAPLWKFHGANSIFMKPFVKDDLAWLDQGNEIVAISLKSGKVERKFSTPGGAGSPFIMNKILYSASPKRLLYGFSL